MSRRLHKGMTRAIIGIILIIAGAVLSVDFILSFAKAAIGIILLIIGISLVMNRRL